jgi:hypothetical protein
MILRRQRRACDLNQRGERDGVTPPIVSTRWKWLRGRKVSGVLFGRYREGVAYGIPATIAGA